MTDQEKRSFKALEEHLEKMNREGTFTMKQSAETFVILSQLWRAMSAPKEVKEVSNKEEKS